MLFLDKISRNASRFNWAEIALDCTAYLNYSPIIYNAVRPAVRAPDKLDKISVTDSIQLSASNSANLNNSKLTIYIVSNMLYSNKSKE
jgi:hypothetical protein